MKDIKSEKTSSGRTVETKAAIKKEGAKGARGLLQVLAQDRGADKKWRFTVF